MAWALAWTLLSCLTPAHAEADPRLVDLATRLEVLRQRFEAGLTHEQLVELARQYPDLLVSRPDPRQPARDLRGNATDAQRLADLGQRLETVRVRFESLPASGSTSSSSAGGGDGSIPAGGGAGGNLFAGGGAFGLDTGATRWDRVKRVIADLGRAYVDQDLGGFRAQLAPEVIPDFAIFSNAIQEDYQAESDFRLDFVLGNRREELHRICTDVQWNRSAVRNSDGVRRVEDGTCKFCHTRDSGWRLATAQGRLPFGLSDPALQQQAGGGQLVIDPTNPGVAPLPEGVQTLTINLDNIPGREGNVAFIDLETGAVRKVEAATADVDGLVEEPGEDICVAVKLEPTLSSVGMKGRNGGKVFPCDVAGQPLAALRRIDPTRLQGTADTTFGPTVAVQTAQGNFAFVRFEGAGGARIASYVISRDPLVQPSGTADCP